MVIKILSKLRKKIKEHTENFNKELENIKIPIMVSCGYMPRSGIALFLVFWGTSILFSTVTYQFTFPPTVKDLHFLDDEQHSTSFPVSVGHLHIFFRKMFIQILCPYFNPVVCFLILSCMISLRTLHINALSDIFFGNTFSHSVDDLPALLIISFRLQRFSFFFLEWWSPTCLFLPSFPFPEEIYPKPYY